MQDDHLTDNKRLAELEKYTILDRESGESFDRFCLAVRNVLATPVAAFTLAGHLSEWNVGMSGTGAHTSLFLSPIARAVVTARRTLSIANIARDGGRFGLALPPGGLVSAVAAPVIVEGDICLGA